MSANVAVTQDTANPYSEADLRYNPGDLNQIIAGSNANAGTVQAQYYSADGGTTWHQSSLPAVSGDSFQSDPAVDWTSDGTAWALTIGVTATITSATLVVRCFKSVNGGKDWTFDSVVSGAETATDKPSLWVDHSPTSPHRDHMYAIWHVGKDSFVSVRNGPGGTWGTPLQLTGTETTSTSDGDDIKTNANGDVFAFWPSAGNQKLFVAKSTDGGASFSALGSSPVQIGSTSGSFTIKIPAQATRATNVGTIGTLIAISAGAYRAGTEDLVFACWHDLAGGTGCNSPSNAPGTSVTSTCKTRVWFTRSTNGGQNWQPAIKINDQSGLNDQFFPRLAVDELTGNLMIIYYDTVNDPNRVAADIWMQYSTDRGMTWSPAVRVTTQPTTEATGSQDNSQEFGDYIGLSGVYGRYFGCWTDRRGGGDEQIYGAPLAVPGIEFALNKATFGQDEISLHSSWPSALWLDVNGFTNESLGFNHTSDLANPPNPAPSVSVTIDPANNPSLTSAQVSGIGSHLPTVTFGPEPILAADPTLTAELQQFMYPYTVAFADQQAFGFLNSHQAAVLTLSASLTVGPITVHTTAFLELTKGEDPFFYDLDPSHPTAYPSWLSYDLRFFTVTPSQAHHWFSVPNPTGPADAADYIGKIIDNLNNPSQITNGDTFENSLQQSEDLSSLEFLQANSSSHELVFNYAVARVRVQAATAVTLPTVRVFFRLFQAASTASTFTEVGTGEGAYRWGSNGTPNHKIALLGVQTDQQGHLEYVTIPCFAAPRVNLTSPADMKTQTDPKNAHDIATVAGAEVDTYFGCWIDQNQPGQTFLPGAPPTAQSNWDGPWTGTTSISALINASPHQCLIAEIRYDDTPIPSGADSATSDKLAQRNIAWIDGPNPGATQSRVMAHPFEVDATSRQATAPDELVIDWGNTPRGSTAEIYLPAVSAHEVTRLADRMYLFHELTAFDSHTIECPAHGLTYLPLPAGAGRYAGLLSVTLPAGIKRGDQYNIVARQLTTKGAVIQPPGGDGPPQQPRLTAAVGSSKLASALWRQVRGAFQFALVIKTKEEVLYPEERLLAWLRWRIGQTNPANRWYEVLRHYEHIVAGRVSGFGGDPAKIPPSQYGDVPGREPGPARHPHLPEPSLRDRHYTGKVTGIAFDRFGDFHGFTLRTQEGREHTFRGREHAVEELVNRAWIERFTITVTVDEDSDWPEAVILRRAG